MAAAGERRGEGTPSPVPMAGEASKRASPEGGFAAVVSRMAKICNRQPSKNLCAAMQPAMNMLARSLRDLGQSKYEKTRQKYTDMKCKVQGEPHVQRVCTCTGD